MSGVIFLLLAIAAEVGATTALKISDGMRLPGPSVAVVVGYILAFALLGQSLRVIPIGIAYTVWAGLGTVVVALIGRIGFGEVLPPMAWAGIALVLLGTTLLGASGAGH